MTEPSKCVHAEIRGIGDVTCRLKADERTKGCIGTVACSGFVPSPVTDEPKISAEELETWADFYAKMTYSTEDRAQGMTPDKDGVFIRVSRAAFTIRTLEADLVKSEETNISMQVSLDDVAVQRNLAVMGLRELAGEDRRIPAPLITRIKALLKDIGESPKTAIEAENSMLSKGVDGLQEMLAHSRAEVHKLKSENAELKKAVCELLNEQDRSAPIAAIGKARDAVDKLLG